MCANKVGCLVLDSCSRSQCIIIIRNVVARHDEVDVPLNTANLTFVDLAGAEREKKTGNQVNPYHAGVT